VVVTTGREPTSSGAVRQPKTSFPSNHHPTQQRRIFSGQEPCSSCALLWISFSAKRCTPRFSIGTLCAVCVLCILALLLLHGKHRSLRCQHTSFLGRTLFLLPCRVLLEHCPLLRALSTYAQFFTRLRTRLQPECTHGPLLSRRLNDHVRLSQFVISQSTRFATTTSHTHAIHSDCEIIVAQTQELIAQLLWDSAYHLGAVQKHQPHFHHIRIMPRNCTQDILVTRQSQ